jgi:hypothetical protein
VTITPDGRSFKASAPTVLFTQPRTARQVWNYSTDARLDKFLMILPRQQVENEAVEEPITVILNLVANLKR